MTATRRGDLAERLLPVAARLACVVHGEGGATDVAHILRQLDVAELEALAVILAGLVDPERSVDDALGWVTWDEHGNPIQPARRQGTVRVLSGRGWHVRGTTVDDVIDSELKHAARVLTARGMGPREIGRRLGVDERTVARWKRAGDWHEPVVITSAESRSLRGLLT